MNIIKKALRYACYCCNQKGGGEKEKRTTCKSCNGTGIFQDEVYYHIITDKNGNQYCFDGDTIK